MPTALVAPGQVTLSPRFIDRVIYPIKKSGKIASSILMFKDAASGDVVISTYDSERSNWVCVKTKEDNVSFDGSEIGILELSDFSQYIDLTSYGDDESSYIKRVESRTARGVTMDCLELGGPIGKFTMPLAHRDSFQDDNRRVQPDQGATTETETPLAMFRLSKRELSQISSIGSSLGTTKVTISIMADGIHLFFKGRGNNQYTKVLDADSTRLYSVDGVPFVDTEDYDKYIPFGFSIFKHANEFNEDFTFEMGRRNGIYFLKAYAGQEGSPSLQDAELPDGETASRIRYGIITAYNPNNSLGGNEVDVFEVM